MNDYNENGYINIDQDSHSRPYTSAELMENDVSGYSETRVSARNSTGYIVPQNYQMNNEMMLPENMTNNAYIPAYLRKQIGRWVRAEFLVGKSIVEKVGQLIEVGTEYIILKLLEPATTMLCDVSSIKFITIIYDANVERLYTT